MSANNEAIVRRLFDEVWHKRNFALTEQLIASNHVNHDPANPGRGNGPEGYNALVRLYTTAFPDTHFTIEQIITQGEMCAVRWIVTGTHRGELNGIAPTGKRVMLNGMSVFRITGGKIVETRTVWDALGLMQQLGVIRQTAYANL